MISATLPKSDKHFLTIYECFPFQSFRIGFNRKDNSKVKDADSLLFNRGNEVAKVDHYETLSAKAKSDPSRPLLQPEASPTGQTTAITEPTPNLVGGEPTIEARMLRISTLQPLTPTPKWNELIVL